jgi:prepilin-type N-terminal cleavage/methylation domain-containing protein
MRPILASVVAARGRGFTIVELTLAVAILGVLTSIAYASYQSFRERTQIADAVSAIGTIAALVEQHRAEPLADVLIRPRDLIQAGHEEIASPALFLCVRDVGRVV